MPFDAGTLIEEKVEKTAQPREQMPVFKPRNDGRLDFRPVAWSLRNRPDEWARTSLDCITHNPSRHSFYVYRGNFSLLASNGCSCNKTRRQSATGMDWWRVRSAFRAWQRYQRNLADQRANETNTKFMAHFLTPSK